MRRRLSALAFLVFFFLYYNGGIGNLVFVQGPFRALVIEESQSRGEYGWVAVAQGWRDYMVAHTDATSETDAYRLFDQNLKPEDMQEPWRTAFVKWKESGEPVPSVAIIRNGSIAAIVPLPKTETEFVELLKTYGG